MKRECVFRIEVEGWLWRVEASPFIMTGEPRTYRIMHRRRCYGKLTGYDAQKAIVQCIESALGCRVDVKWGTQA